MNRRNAQIINEEVVFDEAEELVSTTDLRGVITYANDAFCKVAGYSINELVGKNHNIVRHPDMPKAAFADLWQHLKAGEAWRGAVKNRCKDGRYYWVDAFVTPIYEKGEKVGYQSVRRKLNPAYRQRAETFYRQVNSGQNKWAFAQALQRFKIPLFVIIAAFILLVGTKFYWANSLLVLLPFILFRQELWQNRQFFQQLAQQYDLSLIHI